MFKKRIKQADDVVEKHKKAVDSFSDSINILKKKTGYNGDARKSEQAKVVNLPVKQIDQKAEPFSSIDRLVESINLAKKKVEG